MLSIFILLLFTYIYKREILVKIKCGYIYNVAAYKHQPIRKEKHSHTLKISNTN